MDRRFQERLIGAVVLVGAAIVILPAVLSGPGAPPQAPAAETTGDPPMRSQTIQLEPPAPDTPVEPAPAERVPPPERVEEATKTADVAVETPAPVAPAKNAAGPTPPDSTPPVPAPAAPAPGEAPGWAVQVGNFASKANADALVARLQGQGYAAFVMPRVAGQTTTYRVRVGPEADVEAARAVERRLEAAGNAGAHLVRQP